jgi:hypothetical protein
MRNSATPRRPVAAPTRRLPDLVLDDRESVHRPSRAGDWALLGVVVAVLLGNGAYVWHQLGPEKDHEGRAIFFGLALLCVLWAAVVYTFKLAVSVRVGPHGLSVVRGPWRTELAWREVGRLTERAQAQNGQSYRWVVALARDGRSMRVREDMVGDYQRFRLEIYERYRMWRDHGGTWGATNGGPFTAREAVSTQVTWWAIAAGTLTLPAIYVTLLLPELGIVGPAGLALAAGCVVLSLRALVRRQGYIVDAKAIQAKQLGRTVRLTWRDVARIDRARLPLNAALKAAIMAGRIVLRLAARTDARVQTFDWYPRLPEYLILRGVGRQVRIRLHRVAKPDELLAWVEFYERVGRRAAASEQARRTAPPTRTLAPEPVLEPAPVDLTSAGGPADPWGGGRKDVASAATASEPYAQSGETDSWLRAEPTPPPAARTRDQLAAVDTDDATDTHLAWRYGGAEPSTQFVTGDATNGTDEPADSFAARWRPPTAPPQPTPFTQAPPPPHGVSAYMGSVEQLWAPTGPVDPAYARQVEEAWPELEEASAGVGDEGDEGDEGAATESAEKLADAFAPWRTDPNWQRPQLPRFGPPTDGRDD